LTVNKDSSVDYRRYDRFIVFENSMTGLIHVRVSEEGKEMKPKIPSFTSLLRAMHSAIAILMCLFLIVSADPIAFAAAVQEQPAGAADPKLPNDELDSLVAPVALYPDNLLAQILAASTYPLEIVQLSQWMQKNPKVTGDKAVAEVKKQDWDPSVQGLVILPDVVKILNDNIKWTTDLGNAFLAQQSDVMDAVQRMRAKAKSTGNLKTNDQQKVETKVVETKEVIVIQPAKTEVVYVPSYDPVVVYGPPVYPYPPYVYPPGYAVAGMALSFGVGMMVGAAWGGGGWGCGWGHNDVNINVNNNFVNNSNRTNNIQGGNRVNGGGNNSWQHNPQHRGGTPYSNKATANKYGGTARGDSMSSRQQNARQNQGMQGNRGQSGVGDRNNSGRGGDRGGASVGSNDRGGGNRGASAGNMDRGGGGGGDRIGNQKTSGGSGGTFGSGGSNRSSASASSSRGSSSMGSRGGGGGSRGGGGRGGGGRR